ERWQRQPDELDQYQVSRAEAGRDQDQQPGPDAREIPEQPALDGISLVDEIAEADRRAQGEDQQQDRDDLRRRGAFVGNLWCGDGHFCFVVWSLEAGTLRKLASSVERNSAKPLRRTVVRGEALRERRRAPPLPSATLVEAHASVDRLPHGFDGRL